MSETPRNDEPFDVTQHMPAGAKLTDPVDSDWLRRQGHPGWVESKPAYAPQPQKPAWVYPVAIAAALVLGAVCGAILTPNETPRSCISALAYAEQGLTQSAKGMESMGNAVGGNMGKMMKAQQDLEDVTAELNRLSPLYKEAKEECTK